MAAPPLAEGCLYVTRTVLLDLDGTLVESGPGIIAHIRHAMRVVGHELDPAEDLSWVVGPPLHDIFSRLLDPFGGGERVEAAAASYRESYDSAGYLMTPPYPAIPPVLAALRDAGFALLVATSKPAAVARRILAHVGLAGHFRAIYGAAADGVLAHKPELIAYILATQGLDPAATIMVGDRRFDISGAHANEVRAIGVLWGYGGREELEQAGADALAEVPADLPGLAARLCHGGPRA
jgi:phosphoglycolate phosphatase